jgi:large subunit ribosomal protein L3
MLALTPLLALTLNANVQDFLEGAEIGDAGAYIALESKGGYPAQRADKAADKTVLAVKWELKRENRRAGGGRSRRAQRPGHLAHRPQRRARLSVGCAGVHRRRRRRARPSAVARSLRWPGRPATCAPPTTAARQRSKRFKLPRTSDLKRAMSERRKKATMKGLIGKKVGMTQVFNEEGNAIPVTVIDTTSLIVVGKRTPEKDKYSAVQLGLGVAKDKHLSKAQIGSFKKAGAESRRIVKEFRVTVEEAATFTVGAAVSVEMFKKGELVDVTGTTKGRGYQGVMKRWNFRGFGQTHGTHEYRRHPGAIGQRKTPGRVYPNKKLPGHYGVEQVTTQNLAVVEVLPERGLILVQGAVPGSNNGLVIVKPSVKVALRAKHKGGKK